MAETAEAGRTGHCRLGRRLLRRRGPAFLAGALLQEPLEGCLRVQFQAQGLLQKARQDRQRYWDCMKWLGVTVLLSLVLFAMVGIISSALEIFFVLSTTLLARRLWYLERGGGKN